MDGPWERWLDQAAGPVVRPYAMTRGRTKPASETFNMMTFVVATQSPGGWSLKWLGPEHLRLLELCRWPNAVAEVAAFVDLPMGVIRVLLGDLHAEGLISICEPPAARRLTDEDVLKEVLNGLRAI
jgi:hypothetical protein